MDRSQSSDVMICHTPTTTAIQNPTLAPALPSPKNIQPITAPIITKLSIKPAMASSRSLKAYTMAATIKRVIMLTMLISVLVLRCCKITIFSPLLQIFQSFFILPPLTHLLPCNPHEYWAEASGGERAHPHFSPTSLSHK